MAEERIGVLMMALGGPDSLDAVEPFLRNVRGGRPTSAAMVEAFQERYRLIGGKSPLLAISTAQAQALEDRLNAPENRFRAYIGMRHWSPFIHEVVSRMSDDGIQRVVAVCLTPYYSRMSVGAYFADLDRAIEQTRSRFEIERIDSWNDVSLLTAAFANKVGRRLETLRALGYLDPFVAFTAHSLPVRITKEGDPYERELRETMTLILKQLPPLRSRLCYHSAGQTDETWLGPSLEAVIDELGKAGERAILVAPFGFVSDHLEILYDVDIEAKRRATELGVRFERAESLNVDPTFIEAMATVVREAVRVRGWAEVTSSS